ncbi:MAG: hypothetical protein JWM07_948 [Candidatus Saccharibacteria bacterium]|nr:hypothetical protein [Candidatus Saccharibacteria bacterium]
MEPKLPEANNRSEQSLDGHGQYFEQAPMPQTPESGIEAGAERVEQRSEATPVAVNNMPVLPPLQVAATPIVTPAVDSNPLVVDDNPIAASDDDLIEKEWVDKAKKIIMQTKDDPYRREIEVNKLQADYLRKRYGKELGSSQ